MPRAALLFLLAALTLTAADTQGIEFFEKQVRPLLAQHCYACHGPSQQFSSLRLDSREGMLKGGNRGPAVVPSDPAASLVTKAIHYNGLKMPPGGKLNEQQIAAIEKWIAIGAPWPAEGAKAARTGNPGMYEKLMREHWAFQPVREPAVPPAANSNWSSQPIDRFILATLEKNGLKPSPPAPREALIRRLALVLTGLPPTPLEVDLFVRDQFPGAWERLVDRLLKSPHFGEQWARHWMDVMRFAETYGNDWNYEINGAYRYRDYLIRAFNEDVPYDQLIREHFAGDLLPRPRMNPENGINESIIGTAFFRLGELGHDDCIRFRQIRTDVVDNQIDTIGKAFQGLTIACARCHDHKLDPIPTADYYALYGVLTSSRMVTHTADLPPVNASIKQNLAQRKPLIRAELAKAWRGEIALMPRYLMAAYRAVNKLPTQPEDLTELSLDRIEAWVKVLDKPKSTLEDPLYPFLHSSPQIEARYRSEARARVEFNKVNFRPFGDLTRDGFGGWHAEGNAVDGPSPSGEFAIAAEGPEAITGIYPAGFYTHSLSERLNAAMRSPLVPKDKKFISIQVMGGHLGARRAILDNCMLSEDYKTLDQPSPRWIKIPNRNDQPDLPFYLELVTKQDNPRIPDRPGRLKATPEEVASPFSYFGITRAVLHDADEPPRDELSYLLRLFGRPVQASPQALANRYGEVLRDALENWAAGKATDDDARWLEWLLENHLLTNSTGLTPQLSSLIADYRATDARIHAPTVVYGMADMDAGYNFPVLPGGDAEHPGRLVPRGFLHLLGKGSTGFQVFGSGRREVAELIASPANPLTARVMVNRIWQHLFGRGIVATSDNFGAYGERPTHPELLDYLATEFVRQGWSVKKLIREIVLSRTFQQSSHIPRDSGADPRNQLLSHYPLRRLEAESIRDSILAVSGRLDLTMYGQSVQPHREQPKEYRKLFQGPLDGNGRRSIYIKVTRHEGSQFLESFDFPNPNVARGNRDTTNVPAQALALLNDPFVIDQAGVWADRLLEQPGETPEQRLQRMFRSALSRSPSPAELERFLGMTREMASLHKVSSDKLMTSREVWKDVAHSFYNLKEFLYVP